MPRIISPICGTGYDFCPFCFIFLSLSVYYYNLYVHIVLYQLQFVKILKIFRCHRGFVSGKFYIMFEKCEAGFTMHSLTFIKLFLGVWGSCHSFSVCHCLPARSAWSSGCSGSHMAPQKLILIISD